jgi:hypothetical protein
VRRSYSGWWVLVGLAAAALGCASSADVEHGPSASLRAYADALSEGRADDAYRLLSDDAKRSISLEAFRRMVKENRDDALEIARALRRSASDPVVTATIQTPDGDELTLVYEAGSWRVDGAGIDRYGQSTPRQALLGFLRAFERKRYDVIMRYVPSKEIEGEAEKAWGSPRSAGPPEAPSASAAPGPSGSVGLAAPSAAASSAAPKAGPSDAKGKSTKIGAESEAGLTAEKLRAAWEGDQKEYISRIVQAIKAALPTASIEETQDRAAMPYGAGGTVSFVREAGLWRIENLQ